MQLEPQPLTPKEKKILEFIEGFCSDNGFSPTFQEIKDHFEFASYNSVQRYLKQLETKNYLSVPGGNKKRAITVVNTSSALQDSVIYLKNQGAQKRSFTTGGINNVQSHEGFHVNESLSLPLLGKIAAGLPIESTMHDEFVDVPATFVKNSSRTYALQVEGLSMIEEGIHDGDIILVEEQNRAYNGEIVVAMVDGEATVKKYYLHKNDDGKGDAADRNDEVKVELRPANATMESFWYSPNEVEIRGVLVGLMRKYV